MPKFNSDPIEPRQSFSCSHGATLNADHMPDNTLIRPLVPAWSARGVVMAAPTFARIGDRTSTSGTSRLMCE